jgi:hypothetical protein
MADVIRGKRNQTITRSFSAEHSSPLIPVGLDIAAPESSARCQAFFRARLIPINTPKPLKRRIAELGSGTGLSLTKVYKVPFAFPFQPGVPGKPPGGWLTAM